jgi:hypothetical protein
LYVFHKRKFAKVTSQMQVSFVNEAPELHFAVVVNEEMDCFFQAVDATLYLCCCCRIIIQRHLYTLLLDFVWEANLRQDWLFSSVNNERRLAMTVLT